jgi:two-component system chemotaxis sensor kinase CheA
MSSNDFQKQNSEKFQNYELDFDISAIFLQEATQILNEIEGPLSELEKKPQDHQLIDLIFRKIHTIKGGTGAVPNSEYLSQLAHGLEDFLGSLKNQEIKWSQDSFDVFLKGVLLCKKNIEILKTGDSVPEPLKNEVDQLILILKSYQTNSSIKNNNNPAPINSIKEQARFDIDDLSKFESDGMWLTNEQLDRFMNLSSELIIIKNFYSSVVQSIDIQNNLETFNQRQSEFTQSLGKITDLLQSEMSLARKVSLDKALSVLPRLVRQASQDLNKRVRFKINGLNLTVDKNLAKAMSSCLVHIIRNAIDHGIETPHERLKKGKKIQGTIDVKIYEINESVYLQIQDDGNGINHSGLIKKALEKGLITEIESQSMSPSEINALIFNPGMSTKNEVSSISGRGVGMDVVLSSVKNFSGNISILSEKDQGTQFVLEFQIPKSIRVEKTVLLKWNDWKFAMPIPVIERIVPVDELLIHYVNDIRCCDYNGETIPILNYFEILGKSNSRNLEIDKLQIGTEDSLVKTHYNAIILKIQGQFFGFLIDQILGQMDIVLRPFDPFVGKVRGVSGVAVLGDNELAMVLSPLALKQTFHLKNPRFAREQDLGRVA